MDEVVIPLSVTNIKRLARQLRLLAKEANLNWAGEVERELGANVATLAQARIADIADVDGNYLGSDNPNAAVMVRKGLIGHDVVWSGGQIVFLEFGTGAAGAGAVVDPVTMGKAGYTPDPTNERWAYLDDKTGKAEISVGIKPQAPMYATALTTRNGMPEMLKTSGTLITEAVRRAITV